MLYDGLVDCSLVGGQIWPIRVASSIQSEQKACEASNIWNLDMFAGESTKVII